MTSSSADAPTGRAVRLALTSLLVAFTLTTTLRGGVPEPTSALLTDTGTLTTTVRTAADFDVPVPPPTPTAPGPTATTTAGTPVPAPSAPGGARPAARADGR